MPKLLRTKMIQHSYTVGLRRNRRAEALSNKGFVADFLRHCLA